MNALRVLLILTLIIYFGYYESGFIKYFITITLLYYFSVSLIFRKNLILSSKLNFFLSFWTYPSDPTIYVSNKLELTDLLKKMEKYSEEFNTKIRLTSVIIKAKAILLKEFALANTVVVLGKVRLSLYNI